MHLRGWPPHAPPGFASETPRPPRAILAARVALVAAVALASGAEPGALEPRPPSPELEDRRDVDFHVGVEFAPAPRDAVGALVMAEVRFALAGEAALRTDLEAFYRARGWDPAWLAGDGQTARARALAELLDDARRKGLDPADYGGGAWVARLDELARRGSDAERAATDVALSAAVARFALDLRRGRVDPRSLDFELPVDPGVRSTVQLLEELAAARDVGAAIEALEPRHVPYQRARRALETYLELAARPQPERLRATPRAVSSGSPYAQADALEALLARLGDLPGDAPRDPPGTYGPQLAAATARFQRRHGLDATGRLDPATVRELNVPPARRLVQLALALERWRWLPRSLSPPLLVVNIPEYELHAVGGEGTLRLRVVVGRAVGAQTPVFSAELSSVVFRPSWNVPRSIARDELLPSFARDPSLVERGGYEFVEPGGRLADVSGRGLDALLKDARAGKVGVRQKPGPRNALGPVKFVLPNAHDVYLHGTPATSLFAASRRDFSHGCIRVQRPEALVAWLLRDAGWDEADALRAMREPRTRVVALPRPVPVLLLYATAVVNEEGTVEFLPDVYGHDAALERALSRRGAVETALR